LINSPDYDFSFSGLKTAVVNLVGGLNQGQRQKPTSLSQSAVFDLAAAIQEAVVDVLATKTSKAVRGFKASQIVVGGGVAANQRLREVLVKRLPGKVHFPSPQLSVDNAATIAAAAFFNYQPTTWEKVRADAAILI
jgi:N6-L-threonylcarbamoyladenine synthase